jgi:hypothetical protein
MYYFGEKIVWSAGWLIININLLTLLLRTSVVSCEWVILPLSLLRRQYIYKLFFNVESVYRSQAKGVV